MNFMQAAAGNYKAGRADKIKYIVIHYTANNGDTALGNAKYFRGNKNLQASAHYFVDENEVWQAVKDSDTAFHCGAKQYKHPDCRNANAIGVELCSRKNSSTYYFKDATVRRAAALVQGLMAKYSINAAHVLRHYDVTGKNCPAPFVEDKAAWRKFLNILQEDGEMEKQIKIKLNGVIKEVKAIEKDGYNYIKLQDLRDKKIQIDFDKIPVITCQ